MARPKSEDPRNLQVGCRLTESEMADVHKALAIEPLKQLGPWIRELLLGACRRRLRSERRK